MSTGGLYVHTLYPMMVRYSSTVIMTASCPLVRPSLKWLDFRPTSIPAIYSSRLLMPSCVMSQMIRMIFYFWELIVSWTELAVLVELGIETFWFRF